MRLNATRVAQGLAPCSPLTGGYWVVLADRFYCSYWKVALLLGRGIDIVMRLHQRRQVDVRRLGREDHVVSWTKPKRPVWMDEPTYAVLPATADMRELRVLGPQRGFRTRVVLVATTLEQDGHPVHLPMGQGL